MTARSSAGRSLFASGANRGSAVTPLAISSGRPTASGYDLSVRIAVIGGGINGAGIAWELARREYEVTLFDKGQCGAQTSSATTKLIHGGLRYLQHFHVGLVRESLRERAWLLEHLAQLVHPLEILLPVYRDSPRSRMIIAVGLTLYDFLAAGKNIHRHESHSALELAKRAPLIPEDLRGGFSYWDAQVDDHALVQVVVSSAKREGAEIREMTRVVALRRRGRGWNIWTEAGEELPFDF